MDFLGGREEVRKLEKGAKYISFNLPLIEIVHLTCVKLHFTLKRITTMCVCGVCHIKKV